MSAFAEDVFTPEEHLKIDKLLSNILKIFDGSQRADKLSTALLRHLCWIIGTMNKTQLISTDSMIRNIPDYLEDTAVRAAIEDAFLSGEYSTLGNLAIFRNSQPLGASISHSEGMIGAPTVPSWDGEYVGTAAQVLLETIESHYKTFHYATKYMTIVQSSGMGKSRMIDELSKKVLVIPINLRDGNDTGFPAPDHSIRDFLVSAYSYNAATWHSNSLLIALFKTAGNRLKNIDTYLAPVLQNVPDKDHPKDVFNKFRLFMTAGQDSQKQGKLRKNFYSDVVRCATQLMNTQPLPTYEAMYTDVKETLTILGASLARTTNDLNCSRPEKIDVVIAFDEAHILNRPVGGPNQTRSLALRRALRDLEAFPVFTLFISIDGGAVIPTSDASSRILSTSDVCQHRPFTELGFDQMVDIDINKVSIFNLSRVDYMAKFGRPLFGSHFKYGSLADRSDIIRFAAIKLLGGETHAGRMLEEGMEHTVTPAAKLACLSLRLALELTTTTDVARKRELEQVENHLRICIAVDEYLDNVVTASPSEPLLAMAAQMVMKRISLPESLLGELQTPGIAKGFRGEVIALVILILAIDATVANSDPPPNPQLQTPHPKYEDGQNVWPPTVRSIEMFMQNLLPDGSHQDFLTALPSFARRGEERKQDFKTTFKDSKIYFNHFIKLDNKSMLSRELLYKLIARGAAVLCADHQMGVDIVIPFLFRGDYLNATDVSAIFIQVQNNQTFTHVPCNNLYEFMDPFNLGFFTTPREVVPVIRMVFALAASDAAVGIVKPVIRGRRRPQTYTSYDIWCANVSHKTFKVVKTEDYGTYKNLLKFCTTYPNAYTSGVHSGSLGHTLRRQMNPGMAKEEDHWRFSKAG